MDPLQFLVTKLAFKASFGIMGLIAQGREALHEDLIGFSPSPIVVWDPFPLPCSSLEADDCCSGNMFSLLLFGLKIKH